MERIGVAVVGIGRISAAHLAEMQNLREKADLVAVVSRRGEVAAEAAGRYGARRFYTDYARALEDPEVDAVVLCTPHHTHAPMAAEAARSGKHVLVEKPLGNSLAEADAALAAVQQHGVRMMVGFNMRFMDAVMEAKRRFGEIGQPTHLVQVRGRFVERHDRPGWWKSPEETGGLALPLLGSHVIDTFLWWLERRPRRVSAEAGHHNEDWGGEDEVALTMAFDGGLMASAHLSLNSKQPISERYAIGTEGTLRISDNSKLWINGELVLTENVVPYSLGGHTYRQGGSSYRRQLEEFLDAIWENREPLASARETRPTVEVIDAARASMAEHRPVELPVLGPESSVLGPESCVPHSHRLPQSGSEGMAHCNPISPLQ